MAKTFISGFSNIHIARMKTKDTASQKPTYDVPVALLGAKNISVELTYEGVTFYCDNTVGLQDNYFNGGTINLTVAGLTKEEYKLLFGNEVGKGGVTGVKADDIAPEVAITFSKKILGTNDYRHYVIYGVKLSPNGINAETLADSITEENVELTGVVRALATGEIYSFVDTNNEDYDASYDNWHTEIKFIEPSLPA